MCGDGEKRGFSLKEETKKEKSLMRKRGIIGREKNPFINPSLSRIFLISPSPFQKPQWQTKALQNYCSVLNCILTHIFFL